MGNAEVQGWLGDISNLLTRIIEPLSFTFSKFTCKAAEKVESLGVVGVKSPITVRVLDAGALLSHPLAVIVESVVVPIGIFFELQSLFEMMRNAKSLFP